MIVQSATVVSRLAALPLANPPVRFGGPPPVPAANRETHQRPRLSQRGAIHATGVSRAPRYALLMRKTRRQSNVAAMSNPYGIALNRAWTEWAAKQGVSETIAAALYLISANSNADEVVAKLKPAEVKLVVGVVQRWPESFPPRALAAIEAARRPAHARRPTRPSAAPGSARERAPTTLL